MRSSRQRWWNMGKTSGLVSLPCFTESLPNSAKPDGEFDTNICDVYISDTIVKESKNLLKLSLITVLYSGTPSLNSQRMEILGKAVFVVYLLSVSIFCRWTVVCCFCRQVRVVGPQHQENRMVQRGGGEAASSGQADAHSVEDHCSYHRTHGCPVSGALRIPAVRIYMI